MTTKTTTEEITMTTYTYSIFDANPHATGISAWPHRCDTEIEAESADEALEAVRDDLEVQAVGLSTTDGYEVGQRIFALIWDADGTVVGEPSHDLTDEDLG